MVTEVAPVGHEKSVRAMLDPDRAALRTFSSMSTARPEIDIQLDVPGQTQVRRPASRSLESRSPNGWLPSYPHSQT